MITLYLRRGITPFHVKSFLTVAQWVIERMLTWWLFSYLYEQDPVCWRLIHPWTTILKQFDGLLPDAFKCTFLSIISMRHIIASLLMNAVTTSSLPSFHSPAGQLGCFTLRLMSMPRITLVLQFLIKNHLLHSCTLATATNLNLFFIYQYKVQNYGNLET